MEKLQALLAQESHVVDEALRIDLHALRSIAHLRCNRPEQAIATADEALALYAQTSPTSYLSLPGYAAVAKTYLTVWEVKNPKSKTQNLKSKAKRACKTLRSYARVFPIGQPQACLWQGVFEWRSGHHSKARKLWAKGLAAAGKLAMPYDEGRLHYEIGRQLPPDDPARPEHLAQAKEIFERIGATYDLKRTQDTL